MGAAAGVFGAGRDCFLGKRELVVVLAVCIVRGLVMREKGKALVLPATPRAIELTPVLFRAV